MSDYRINMEGGMRPADTDKLYNLLSILSQEDELVISVDGKGTDQLDSIYNVLDKNEFDVTTKGGHDSASYNIIAKRR
jgi:hypothetical protein